MKGNDLLRAMNGLETEFIESAKENTAAKQHGMRKRKIRWIAGIAAALIVLPAAAYASSLFLHRANVEHYITGTELIAAQSPDAILNAVTENRDYRITVDSALSDGHNVMMVLTHEAKSPQGIRIKADMSFPETYLSYTDGTPGPFRKTALSDETPRAGIDGAYAFDDEKSPIGFDRTVSILNCKDVDPEKDVRIEFFHDLDNATAELYFWKRDAPALLQKAIPDFDMNRNITNALDGLSITVRFAPNVKCVPLFSENGAEVYLSAFELFTEEDNVLGTKTVSEYDEILGGTCEQTVPVIQPDNLFFIRNNGEKEPLVPENSTEFDKTSIGLSDNYNYFIFGRFIDPDAYIGVEINGVQYMRQP